jgi:hypothetical protein
MSHYLLLPTSLDHSFFFSLWTAQGQVEFSKSSVMHIIFKMFSSFEETEQGQVKHILFSGCIDAHSSIDVTLKRKGRIFLSFFV